MKRVLRDLGWLAAFALLAAFLALQVSPVLNPPKWDEYIVAYDAHRIVAGQVPYRDFFNFIPPGIFLFLAACFELARVSTLTVARWVGVAVVLLTTALAAWAFRKRNWGPVAALLWAALFPLALYPFWAMASHHWLAAAAFAGLVAVLAGASELGLGRAFLAGLCVGTAGLCVQTQGVIMVAFCASFIALGAKAGKKALTWLAWLGGVLAVWGPVLLCLAFRGGLTDFIRDTLFWPAWSYSRGSNENVGAILQDFPWRMGDIMSRVKAARSTGEAFALASGYLLYPMILALGMTVVAAAILVLGRSLRHRHFEGPWAPSAALATVLAVGLAFRGNLNWLHFLYLTVPLSLLWICALAEGAARHPTARRAALFLAALLAVAGAAYHTRGFWVHSPETWELTDADRPIREEAVNRFLHKPGNLKPGDTVAAFPEGGEVYLYGAPAALGFTYFKPLFQEYSTVEDHALAARQIEKNKPRWIMFPPDLESGYLDSRSAVAGVIRKDYERYGIVGNAVIYQRK